MAGSRRSTRPPVRRKRIWMRDFGTDTLVGTTPFVRDLTAIWASAGAPNLIGATVIRVRATLAFARTAGSSVLPHVFAGVMVGPSTLDAVDANPAGTPGLHLDWMHWSKNYGAANMAAAAALGAFSVTVDVKAMRKLEELDDTLWLCLSSTLTDEWATSWGVSALVMLP